jgi:hypothetical protein
MERSSEKEKERERRDVAKQMEKQRFPNDSFL